MVILILVIVVRFSGAGAPAPPATEVAQTPAGAGGVDLSQMSPRQAADRLFNRIMQAHEQGNAGQVSFFLPMAIQSYEGLGELDADARYHLGLIQAVGGQVNEALANADTLERQVPTHLFVPMLRATASRLSGDSATVKRAFRSFLDNYDAEITAGRQEYDEHRTAIEGFRDQASQPTGG